MAIKRMWQNTWLKAISKKHDLEVGKRVIIHKRAILKDLSYITREVQEATVVKMYPYMFQCKFDNGQLECFRYNEFLGDESTIIFIKKK